MVAYKIALELTDRRLAFWGAVLVMLEPMSIYWGALLMSDVFFAFLMMLSFWALLRMRYEYTAIALGLAALTRPIALFFIPAFLLFVAWQAHREKKSAKVILRNTLLVAVLTAAIVSPWFARNKIVFDVWGYTSGGWYDLYMYPIRSFGAEKNVPVPVVVPQLFEDGGFNIFDFTYAPEFRSAAFSVIKSDVSGYAVFQVKRSLWSLISNRYEYLLEVVIKNELPSVYAKMPIPLLLAIGMMFWLCVYILVFVALKDKKLGPWWLFFASLVAVNALISGGINPAGSEMSRYSLPFLASLFMFAGVGARVLARFART